MLYIACFIAVIIWEIGKMFVKRLPEGITAAFFIIMLNGGYPWPLYLLTPAILFGGIALRRYFTYGIAGNGNPGT